MKAIWGKSACASNILVSSLRRHRAALRCAAGGVLFLTACSASLAGDGFQHHRAAQGGWREPAFPVHLRPAGVSAVSAGARRRGERTWRIRRNLDDDGIFRGAALAGRGVFVNPETFQGWLMRDSRQGMWRLPQASATARPRRGAAGTRTCLWHAVISFSTFGFGGEQEEVKDDFNQIALRGRC